MSRPRAPGNVTLTTVASAVGVSPTTVSNAYNRPHKLSAALRERILEAARDAAEHLLRLGHRALAVVSPPFGPSRRARHRDPAKVGRPGYRITRERLAGYQAAADAATPRPAALDVYEVAVNS